MRLGQMVGLYMEKCHVKRIKIIAALVGVITM